MKPQDFFKMRFKDYLCWRESYLNKRDDFERVMRKAVGMIISPWLKQAPDMYRYWGIRGDDAEKKRLAEVRDENALKLLNRLKNNNVTYVMVGEGRNRKIVEVVNPKDN